jgi:DNA repair protein RadA/Sms
LKEAAKLGFSSAVAPAARLEKAKNERLPLTTSSIGHIADLVAGIAARRRKAS